MKKNQASSEALIREAVDLEVFDSQGPVTPAPTLPALEQMGDLLIEQNQPAEALVSYRRSLALYPHRFNSLLGAARSAHTLKDEKSARSYYQELLKVADHGIRQPALQEARSFLAERPSR